ncbi:MAG: Dyp-type peroxidase [Nitrospira sp.]|nr:Dyp-type peroxidase [Nitrospira sp.]
MITNDDLPDIQGNILTGYGAKAATYLFYRVDLLEKARQWLGTISERITTEDHVRSKQEKLRTWLNVALTFQGLKALGLPQASLKSFPVEFQQGMTERAPILCDFGSSEPKNWDSPLGTPQLHIMVLVQGDKETDCKDLIKSLESQMIPLVSREALEKSGVSLLGQEKATGLPGDKEHFGFRDGISQPWIEGMEERMGDPIQPHGGKRTIDGPKPLKTGEFILGHEDELNRIPQPLVPHGLSKNGTYLVLRKLSQKVALFREEIEARAEYVFGKVEVEKEDPKKRQLLIIKRREHRDRLMALMVGRWPSGCPVVSSPDKDDPSFATNDKINAFNYDEDGDGAGCPIGAHIRRMNPRDWHPGKDGKPVIEPISTRHRMIRRSLPYGPELLEEPTQDDIKKERGLMFVALVADIARQFEFVQRHWINDGDFFQLDKNERDPLMGSNCDRRDVSSSKPSHVEDRRKFTVPAATRLPWALNLPEFVTTKGGEYFFLPSKTALKALATRRFSSFKEAFDLTTTTITDPRARARAQRGLIQEWLNHSPYETLQELLHKEPNGRFTAPGYPGDMMPTMIVTKYADVCEVLTNPDMTVELYNQKMEVKKDPDSPRPPRGPFILGRNPDDPFYQKEQTCIAAAIKATIPKLGSLLSTILDTVFADIKTKQPRIDVIEDLAWRVPIELADHFFGVPGPDQAILKKWLRDIYKDTFHNLQKDTVFQRNADLAVAGMSSYLDGLIQQLARSGGSPNSVLEELIAIQKREPDLVRDFAKRNIMGLLVGLVDPTLKTIARTVDQLIRRPKELQEVHDAATGGNRDLVLRYVLEAMRFNPMSHVLYRKCRKDVTIAAGTPTKLTIKEGTMVFASTMTAMFDKEGPFKDPTVFQVGRNPGDYLFFGYSSHKCMGQHLITIVIHEVFMHFLAFKNLRRANDDPFNPFDHVPEHLYLEYDL